MVVPIPMLNPVLDGGVILGVGYFHPQTREQAATQPASVSDGGAAAFEIDRQIGNSDIYLGLPRRVLEADETFGVYIPPIDDLGFELENTIKSHGLCVAFMRDRRDTDYETLDGYLRHYRKVSASVVLAGEVRGCHNNGDVPLGDTCMLSLRGFPATNYLARRMAQARVESRCQMAKRWGLAVFGGSGDVTDTFSGRDGGGSVESYGLGIRFTVLPQKRPNMRLDYGRSSAEDAWYVSVGEAF